MKNVVSAERVALSVFLASILAMVAPSAAGTIEIPTVGRLPQKMQMHGTAVVDNRLYVFGGDLAGGDNSTLWTDKVRSTAINTGSIGLGKWRDEAPLPQMRTYMANCVEVVKNRIYIVGGSAAKEATKESSLQNLNTVTWTTADADGKLQPWKSGTPFPGNPLVLAASCSTDKHLLITGGINSNTALSAIYVADILADGNVGFWRKAGELPIAVYNHGACIQHGRIYVYGGLLEKGKLNAKVFSTSISDKGELGEWREETAMPEAVYGAAYCGINNHLVSIGGRYTGSKPTNDIWYARLDGSHVGAWQKESSNLRATSYHSLGLDKDKGWVFIAGGANKLTGTVEPVGLVEQVQAFQIAASSHVQPTVAQGDLAADSGYVKLSDALAQVKAGNKSRPIMAIFFSSDVPVCKEFWEKVAVKSEFKALKNHYLVAIVDTSGAESESHWSRELGVYKVPCLVEVSADGKAIRKSSGLSTMDDVTRFINGN